jgi:hypothetical protein
MKVAKVFSLSDAQVSQIRDLNSQYIAIKEVISTWPATGDGGTLNLLLKKLGDAKYAYDEWFTTQEIANKVVTNASNSWNVDFGKKELQLLEA